MSEHPKFDSQTPAFRAKILTLDGQEIATGILTFENQKGQFQATEIASRESIESLTEVLAVTDTSRIHLSSWHRCSSPVADHFHFFCK